MKNEKVNLTTELHGSFYSKEKASEIVYDLEMYSDNLLYTLKYLNKNNEDMELETNNVIKQDGKMLEIVKNNMFYLSDLINSIIKNQEQVESLQFESNEEKLTATEEVELIESIDFHNRNNEEILFELVDAIATMHSFVEMVKGLANQINLLSLNASIESYKLGESGKNFSVIAKEIKHLQMEITKTLNDISTELSSVQRNYNNSKENTDIITKKIDSLLEEKNLKNKQKKEIAKNLKSLKSEQSNYISTIKKSIEELSYCADIIDKTLESNQSILSLSQVNNIQLNKNGSLNDKIKNTISDLQKEIIVLSKKNKKKE